MIASDSTVTALNEPEIGGQRVPAVEEGRVHAHRQAALAAFGGADQLQPQAQLAGVLEVVGVEVLDALVAHVLEVHRRPERETGEDRHLGGGVAAGDVVARVGLGVAEALGLGERLVVARAARHQREDEVGRAVDDPVDPLDAASPTSDSSSTLHHRHGARDRGLEAQPHARGPGRSRTVPRRSGTGAACWPSRRPCPTAAPGADTPAPDRVRRSPRRAGRPPPAPPRTALCCGSARR